MGSVVTGAYFDRAPMGDLMPGHIAENDDGATVGGKALRDMTGEQFMHFVFGRAFDALGGRDDVLVVLSCGENGPAAALEKLAPPLPPNFLPCGTVPQLEVLPLCDAFITHGGMGSVMEAALFRVPLCVVPCFGDQMGNADRVEASGMGRGFRYPLRTLSAAAMREATLALSDPDPSNPFRRSLAEVAAKMERTGGAENAADLVFEVAAAAGQGGKVLAK
jgi:UDP:flavonoid glycosyltransferase YjiC (YdhE family)